MGRFIWLAAIGIALGLALTSQGSASAAPALQLPWPTGEAYGIDGGNTYGCGTHGGLGYETNYYAIDFHLATIGDHVAATAAGTIYAFSDSNLDDRGNYIEIDHGGGFRSRYLHLRLSQLFAFAMYVGERVSQGQLIGYSGNTGGVPAHLHFDLKLNGQAYKPEPMSGVTNFGYYGISVFNSGDCNGYPNDPSPSWTSKSPLGRDATNDGCSDVFAREAQTGVLRIYPGNCGGGVGGAVQAGTGWSISAFPNGIVGSTFFDGDNCADLLGRVSTIGSGYPLRLYRGNCSGSYSSYSTVSTAWTPSSLDLIIAPGDMNGDGCADIMAREYFGSYNMRLYPGDCAGHLGSPSVMSSGWDPGQLNMISAAGDLNNDGCNDVVAAENWPPYWLRLYKGNCAGGFSGVVTVTSGWTTTALDTILSPGDFNGDHCADLLAREVSGQQSLRLYPGNCAGGLAAPTVVSSGWTPSVLDWLLPR